MCSLFIVHGSLLMAMNLEVCHNLVKYRREFMAVIAMLICENKEHDSQTPDQGQVSLRGVTSESEIGKEYFVYTPFASLQMGILNPSAFGQFEPGKTYKMILEQVD